MSTKKPSFVTFTDEGHNYVYDRYSNQFLEIDDSFMKELNSGVMGDRLSLLQRKYGILNTYDLPQMSLSPVLNNEQKITKKVFHKIHRLCFITTEECNLRCKYCVYSGSYKNTRLHNPDHVISWDLAKKAVDYFAEVSDGVPSRTISFYGGESLLEFQLIKKIVEYTKNLEIPFQFSINTNLVLLNDEILSFLIDNKFKITVSIDGPSSVHDLYRVTRNQQPTHQIVENNLKRLRNADEEFFINNVAFNTVIVPHNEKMSTLDEYFSGSLFANMPIYAFHVYTLNPNENTFSTKYCYYEFLRKYNEYSKDLFIKNHVSTDNGIEAYRISYNHYIRSIKRIYFRSSSKIDQFSFFWPNSLCILGMRSMLVTASGVMYPCETLYDKHELSIGQIGKGIDSQRIIDVTNEYIEKSSELCKTCWAYRFCYQCFSAAYEKNCYSSQIRKHECAATRRDIINEFKMFLRIVSENPSAFDYLKDVGPDEIFSDMTED